MKSIVLLIKKKKKICALILILLILVGVGMKFWQEEKLKKFVKDTACEEIAERCVIYNPKKMVNLSAFDSCLDIYKKMECDLNDLYWRLNLD